MSEPIIELNDISKSYKLYSRNIDRILDAIFPFTASRSMDFYALKNISFSLEKGESLGIIGENGSGKSSLLKIISGVLTPTGGSLRVRGTLGCLLELGGGFNPELSGFENIKLQLLMNGTTGDIHGLAKSIIEFTDIGDFINYPVKKYSSGMYMRLAFACATAINPSILIVDEALAVGDAFFVKKCMNKMWQLMENDTTLLFVSHDLESVRRLCSKALWLNHGQNMAFGLVKDVAEQYIAHLRQRESAQNRRNTNPSSEDTDKTLLNPSIALCKISSTIDISEQRLFIDGAWIWHNSGELHARLAASPGATAAFIATGSRLSLAFVRGGGFIMPQVFIDDNEIIINIDNDECYPDLAQAPAQIHNFSLLLSPCEHIVIIRATKKNVAWIGGSVSQTPHQLVFKQNIDLMAHWQKKSHISGDGKARICNAEILDATTNEPVSNVNPEQNIKLLISAERLEEIDGQVSIAFRVDNHLSVQMFGTSTLEEFYIFDSSAKLWTVEFLFCMPLKSGEYTIAATIASKINNSYIVHNTIDPILNLFVRSNNTRSIWGEFYNPTSIEISQKF